MTDRPECCPTCATEPGRAPGRYCAPLRCYCGHEQCPAYATWGPAKARQAAGHRQLVQAAVARLDASMAAQQRPARSRPRDLAPAAARVVERGQRIERRQWRERQARAADLPPDPRVPE